MKAYSSLIYSRLAESTLEDYGVPPGGPVYMRSNTCDKGLIRCQFKRIASQGQTSGRRPGRHGGSGECHRLEAVAVR